MARTRMARLPWMIRPNSFLFYHGIVCCVYSLESPHHYVENRKDFPKLLLSASWTGAMINPQWLELPMSRTNFHGPKDVRAIEVWLHHCIIL